MITRTRLEFGDYVVFRDNTESHCPQKIIGIFIKRDCENAEIKDRYANSYFVPIKNLELLRNREEIFSEVARFCSYFE